MSTTLKVVLLTIVAFISTFSLNAAISYDFEAPAGTNGYQKLQYKILSSTDQTVAVMGGTTGIIPCTVTYNNRTYTVTEIGRFAFNDVSLTDFRLPLSLKAIRENAFGWCKAQTIAIPDGVEIIDEDAFWYSNIETIIIGSGVKTIGAGAFYGCSNLKTLVFKPSQAPSHTSRNYSIGNSSTTIIVPQLKDYTGSEIARVSGTMVEPIYFPEHTYVYSGSSPQLEFVMKIGSASTPSDMTLKNKDVGNYNQSFFIGLSSLLPSYRFSDYDGYAVYPNRGIDVEYNYLISKKPLNIAIDNQQRLYGENNPMSFPYSISGFVANETETELNEPIIPNTSATILSDVGDYPITCNVSARNYEIIVNNGILSIQKAPIVAQVKDAERVYGFENPIFACEYIGLKNNDNPNLLTPFKFETATISSNVGEYSIKCSEGSFKNYYVNEYRSGTLTITKAPLVLNATPTSREYCEPNPQFSFTLTGLRNNDTADCLSKQPSFECSATINSDCGEYAITPSSAEALNYSITYNPSVLTITPAQLTITANNSSKIYGDSNPELSYSLTGLKGSDTDELALQQQPSVTTSASLRSNVGDYPIKVCGGIAKNYSLIYYDGVLTIEKASLIAVPTDAERVYGEVNPTFGISYIGLKFQEQTTDVFTTLPNLTCSATRNSNVGTYPIIAQGGVSKNYMITEYKQGTLTISKASLKLVANNATRLYYENNPDFTYSLVGLKNNDTKSVITSGPLYNCGAEISSNCGQYSITPSDATALNYSVAYEDGTLTITPVSITIKASNITREYGEENPILKYELVGLKGNDNIDNALQEKPSLTTTATSSSNVGEYSIIVSGGASRNYTLSYRSGTLFITKAPLSVIAENAERLYGDDNPTFVRSYLGFKLTDTENTAFSVLPKISCSATKSSKVGEYPITVSGGTCRNYEIMSYERGILTIGKAIATLTPINKTRLYFEENPQFDFTLTGLRNGDSKTCVEVLPQYVCDVNKLSNVGTYTILASNAQAANYNFEYGQGSLTINPRQLTASVGNYSRTYGTDNPVFDISYSGFVNREDESVLTQPSIVNCSATKSSDVGTYPITITGGEATNYIISKYNSGNLTIEKADQTIIWNQYLSSIELYSQIELNATSSAGLPVTYEMSPNNVATLYSNANKWFLDCYGSGAVNIRAIQNGDKNHNAANLVSKTLVVYGGGDDPQNPQIYLNIEEAGSLSSMIADNRKYQIKNLRLTGYLNGTDINFLREMSGSDSNGNTTPGVLETLDISGCTIVAGGRSYYKSSRTSDCVVGDYMFYNCKVLTTLHLPNNSIQIGNYSLADCDRLSVVSIPNSVNKFGTEAFRNDISLLRIPMPESLITIDDMAFIGCNGLTEITIPSEVSVIGDGIVKDCENIARINVEIGNSNFASVDGVLFNNSLEELIIFPVNHPSNDYVVADGVRTIAPYAFVNAKGLKVVSLPSTLTTIWQNAFIGCVNLQTLKVQAIIPPICQNDCFESVSKTRCELQVPIGCRSSYWVAPVWSEFNKIVETGFTSIENVHYDDLQIGIINGKISVSGSPEDMTVLIYQINGTLLYQGWPSNGVVQFEPSSNGVYIVMIGNKAYKLMVK